MQHFRLDDQKPRRQPSGKGGRGRGCSSGARAFLVEEAEESSDAESEDDEDGSDLDAMDDSFINDDTQLTQQANDGGTLLSRFSFSIVEDAVECFFHCQRIPG